MDQNVTISQDRQRTTLLHIDKPDINPINVCEDWKHWRLRVYSGELLQFKQESKVILFTFS